MKSELWYVSLKEQETAKTVRDKAQCPVHVLLEYRSRKPKRRQDKRIRVLKAL